MKLRTLVLLLAFFSMAYTPNCFATTVIPFTNLGEMARVSEVVVLATAQENYTVLDGETTRFRTRFIVKENIKGNHSFTIVVQNHQLLVNNMERRVWGDVSFIEGETYLIFLRLIDQGVWQPITLSYGLFREEIQSTNQTLLVPVEQGLQIHLVERPDGQTVEPFTAYETNALISHLKEVVQGETDWRSLGFAQSYHPDASVQARNTPPGHCSFLSGTPYARWRDPATEILPIRFGDAGDPQCTTAPAHISTAIASMNLAYTGIRVSNLGTHNYVPSCSDGAAGNEFVSYLNNNLGGRRNILIQFDDPCNEIGNLSGCSGTLAFGGLYWGGTYTQNGETWQNAGYGFVYLNNGVGNCYCGVNGGYEELIIHELTHSLNLGHITSGTANMNPFCCNDIRDLDIQCVEFLYPSAPQPVTLVDFAGEQIEKSIQLAWATETEINSDYFTLERSVDGQSFHKIATLSAAGSSDRLLEYSYRDDTPATGPNYYRLVQTDFDGRTEQLSTISVSYFGERVFQLHPNPVHSNSITLKWAFPQDKALELVIFDAQGRQVYQNALPTEAEALQRTTLQLPDLVPGMYFAQATQGLTVSQLRFIKY